MGGFRQPSSSNAVGCTTTQLEKYEESGNQLETDKILLLDWTDGTAME
jgi:hypothetical protein